MWFTKSSSSCKNLSFIWLLDCYHISILPPLLHAENCCTIADKIYSKTEVSLIQFSWSFYSIFYDNCTVCIPNFKPFQIDYSNSDLITASSVFKKWTDVKQLSYASSNWIKLEINLIECIYKTYINSIHLLKVISWTYSTQINPILITKHLILSIIL